MAIAVLIESYPHVYLLLFMHEHRIRSFIFSIPSRLVYFRDVRIDSGFWSQVGHCCRYETGKDRVAKTNLIKTNLFV